MKSGMRPAGGIDSNNASDFDPKSNNSINLDNSQADPGSIVIVICTFNRSLSLLETLSSIYADSYNSPELIDILVVANNCTDDTVERLTEFQASHSQALLRLSWISEPKPGKSYALNKAIQSTSHQVLSFIDDDQVVEIGFLQNLIDGINQYPSEDIFCGRLWPAWDGSEPPWVHAKAPYAIPIRPFPEFDLGRHSFSIKPGQRIPSGGNIVVRRHVLDAIGGFSVELGPTGHNLVGGEDHDFLNRAIKHGFSIRYLPEMRQLHAIDSLRMGISYTLRKSYFRSRASFLIGLDAHKPKWYMFRKIMGHLSRAIFTLNSDRRFFYFVRVAASLGEFSGSIEKIDFWRNGQKLPTRLAEPGVLQLTLLGILTASCGVTAWYMGDHANLIDYFSSLAVAGTGALALLIKSLLDFSQTGPRIRDEILKHFRGYTLFSLARLTAWAFAIMVFTGSVGSLVYSLLIRVLDIPWSMSCSVFASISGIVGGFIFQFLRKLRLNPGLLVASMHYRMSRFYRLWNWVTPARLEFFQNTIMVLLGFLALVATLKLNYYEDYKGILSLWSTVIFYLGIIVLSGWQTDINRPPRRLKRRNCDLPNILLIGSDTLRADRLGALGYHRNTTPNLDKLASRGGLFSNCYVPCARTAASLISMLTGTWPHNHGIRDNFVATDKSVLNVLALPELLKTKGYLTAAISDWCGADLGKFSFGFDYYELPDDQWNLKYLIRQGPKDIRLYLSLFTHNRLGRWFLPEIYYLGGVSQTQDIGRRARCLVSRLASGDAPFFMNLFYSTTHPPFSSEWPWYTRYADPSYAGESKFAMARLADPFDIIRRQGEPKEEFDLDQIINLYDGCVAQFDDEVGKMLNHLKISGLDKNTIVVVYSDHGMEFFEHESWGQGNSAVGDFSPKVPLIISDPELSAGRIDAVVRSIDLMPTLLERVGISLPTQLDGVSLMPLLKGTNMASLPAFNETGIWFTEIPGLPENHLRYPDLLELLEVPNRASGTLAVKPEYEFITIKAKDRMIRFDAWKLVYQPLVDGFVLRLYNLEVDPNCINDIANEQPETTALLWARLENWISQDLSFQTVQGK